MKQINGEKLGRWSLRLDASYCLFLGAAIAVFSGHIAGGVALPTLLIAIIGIAVVMWAGGVLLMLAKLPLQLALRLVMLANFLAAIAVAFISISAATVLIALAIIAIAIDIALFASSQKIALRYLIAA